MPRRFDGNEPRVPGADALATNHPTEVKAATMPRYTDAPVATPRNVRGERYPFNGINYRIHCWADCVDST